MTPEAQLVTAVQSNDLDAATRLLGLHPGLHARLNDPLPGLPFDATILQPAVRWQNREMVSLLTLFGADINTKTHWWAGGFSLLDFAEPDFVPFLLQQGAAMTPNAAARLGKLDDLRRMVEQDRKVVHTRGGDGQTPLHVASTVEVARFLLDAGADIDALDVDHESTPAQYLVREHTDVARYLVSRGAKTDILLAAALGDIDRVRAFLDADPSSVNVAVTNKYFPMRNRRAGGHIYTWTLGKHKTAHVVAHEFGHGDVEQLLMSRTPESLALALACQMGDDAAVRRLLASSPGIVAKLSSEERRKLPRAAQDNNATAVRLLLEAGWPVDVSDSGGDTALHWAGFHGNAEMARTILRYKPNLEAKDTDHHGSPLDWALHGSTDGWYCKTGDYPGTVGAMLDAGATIPSRDRLAASDAVRAMLRERGVEAS